MSYTIQQIKTHLVGLSHGGTLNKVRNIESMFERAGSIFLAKIRPLEVIRSAPLSNTVHDDIYNYALPSDFGSIVDLAPQDNRTTWDNAVRNNAGQFDLEKAIRNRTISIEASEGTKYVRINWRSRKGKVLNSMNSYNGNGTWTAVATASGIVTDSIFKMSGSGSVRFDLAATGDGIQNTSMSAVDLTDEDEVADVFIPFYIKDSTDLARVTSVAAVWGNDLTTKYWTGVAQTTQADGTAFKVGWNTIKVPWSTATETGTVDPATIDSFKLTLATTGAISDIRVDNIIFSIGRAFDLKYYSKFVYKSSTSGSWISIPASDEDFVMIDTDLLPHYLFECLDAMAHQVEGEDSKFDTEYSKEKLLELYPKYRTLYPGMGKKTTANYGNRRPSRGRW